LLTLAQTRELANITKVPSEGYIVGQELSLGRIVTKVCSGSRQAAAHHLLEARLY
jgi:hypothetical protein